MKVKTITPRIGKILSFSFMFGFVLLLGQVLAQSAQTSIAASIDQGILSKQSDPTAINDYATTKGGIPVRINVIENDLNPENDTLLIRGAIPQYGRAEIISDSIIDYISAYNFEGIDTVSYLLGKLHDNTFQSMAYLIVDVQASGSYAVLEGNNIKAGINSFGTLFCKLDYTPGFGGTGMEPSFEAPVGSGEHSIFISNLWIGGLNEQAPNSLHLAAERYRQLGADFCYGPISNVYDDAYDMKYVRLWSLSADEISYHINHYTDPAYQMNQTIASWPANGDVNNGQLEQMAPFEDQNANGIYEPMDGDYPLIRGDQAIFFIFNDDRIQHSESQGEKLGVEIHAMAYSFNDISDSALANSVFVHYDIMNRSENNYTNTYFGSFTDLDIGNDAWNDYIGCDVERGSYYAYDANISNGNLAAQSVTILAGPYMDNDDVDNPANNCDESVNGLNFGNGVVDDERLGMTGFMSMNNGGNPALSDPDVASEYYDFMRGIWKDQTHLLYGGNGHINSSAVGPECSFIFPGDSDPCNWGTNGVPPNGGFNQNGYYWTEESMGNTPGDRRGISATGPFTYEAGEVQELDLAFVFAKKYENKDIDILDILRQRLDTVKQLAANNKIFGFNQLVGVEEGALQKFPVLVYPNPCSQDNINVSLQSNNVSLIYHLYDNYGRTLQMGEFIGNQINKISLKGLSKGIYMIRIDDPNSNEVYMKKILKY